MSNSLRHLHLRGALGAAKTEMWNGREHLVVPCVALQEAVIHAVNAKHAEFVPSATLSNSVTKWNGHPLVLGHPTKDGKQISAHDDAVLAKHGFGLIRHGHMNGTRLGLEALVDPARLVELKQDALLADLRAGKSIEVSVGAFVTTNDKQGTHNGRDYNGEWQDITPDHLAFLPNGTGACSMEMGCGAHRHAERYLVTAEGFERQQETRPMPKTLKDIKARILALFDTPEQQQSEEDAELVRYNAMRATHDALGDAWDEVDGLLDELIAAEATHVAGSAEDAETEIEVAKLDAVRMHCMTMSGMVGALINAAYPMPNVSPSRYMEQFKALYGKTISKATMGTVQKAHDASHDMHSHTVALGAECNGMKLLAAARMKNCPTCDGMGQIHAKDCPTCEGSGEVAINVKAAESASENHKETVMTADQKAAALKALATCGCKTVPETDDQIVAAFIAAAETHGAELKTAQDAKAEADVKLKALETKAPDVKPLTKDEILKASPEIATIVAEHEARVAAEKTGIVKALEATKVLTAEQLNALPIEQLRTMAQFAKIEAPADYSGRGVAVPRAAETQDFTPPDPYAAPLKTLQEVKH